jgi:hypothetical protein
MTYQPLHFDYDPGQFVMTPMRAWIVTSLLFAGFGCSPESEPAESAPAAPAAPAGAAASAELTPDDVDRLTQLGYLDSAPEPADAAKTGVVIHDARAVAAGQTLVTNHKPCRATLYGGDGGTLRSWSRAGNCRNWVNTRLLGDGRLLVVEGKGGLALHGANGPELWRRRIGAHHDATPRADGRFAVLLHEHRQLAAPGAVPSPFTPDAVGPPEPLGPRAGTRIIDDLIAVVTQEGQVVEQQSIYDLWVSEGSFETDPETLPDLLHTNSVQWLDGDRVLVSIRNQDRIAIVDWRARRILWSWGPGELERQHDATQLANGHILLFDNGSRRGWSRVLEVDPRSDEIVWQYGAAAAERFYSKGRGAVQRLANGNTLISVSDSGYAFEVTPDRRIVWEFHNPITVRKGDAQHRAPIWVRRYAPRPPAEPARSD